MAYLVNHQSETFYGSLGIAKLHVFNTILTHTIGHCSRSHEIQTLFSVAAVDEYIFPMVHVIFSPHIDTTTALKKIIPE